MKKIFLGGWILFVTGIFAICTIVIFCGCALADVLLNALHKAQQRLKSS